MTDQEDLKGLLIQIRDLSRSGEGRGLTGAPTHTWVNRKCGDTLQIQVNPHGGDEPFQWDGEPCSMCASGAVLLHRELRGVPPSDWSAVLGQIGDRIEAGRGSDPWGLFHPWRSRWACVLGSVECLKGERTEGP